MRFSRFTRLAGLWLLGFDVASAPAIGSTRAPAQVRSMGYGLILTGPDSAPVQSMRFNWMKVFGEPHRREPVNVLLQIRTSAFAAPHLREKSLAEVVQGYGGWIDAYEIGNEVNLDAGYGWAAPPDAAAYVQKLCSAYQTIKQLDPTAVVVSAGLATTGRVSGVWQGHPGHNGSVQDEREYLKEFLTAGGANCADVVGYHPIGFSANFSAAPDVTQGTPETNCINGFCFRTVEVIHSLMAQRGFANKPVWATEMGWITPPNAGCLTDEINGQDWASRTWQIVSQDSQASNLVGAFQYAYGNWPWMGAMFVFNWNFNHASYYDPCQQMRSYSVQGRPAESALRNMPKFFGLSRHAFLPIVRR